MRPNQDSLLRELIHIRRSSELSRARPRDVLNERVRGLIVLVMMGALIGDPSSSAAAPLSWETRSAEGVVTLWRARGDALAARHIVRGVIGAADHTEQILTTELTHPPSGCALELTWSVPEVTKLSALNLTRALSTTQALSRRATRRALPSGWDRSAPKASPETRALRVTLNVPTGATLRDVTWWGCGWGHERVHATTSETTSKTKRGLTKSGVRREGKPTLPHGAKSTRARTLGALTQHTTPPERSLKATLKGDKLLLESERWSFALTLESRGLTPQEVKTSREPHALEQSATDMQSPFLKSGRNHGQSLSRERDARAQSEWRWGVALAKPPAEPLVTSPAKSPAEPQTPSLTAQSQQVELQITLTHRSPKLAPLIKGTPRFTTNTALGEWSILLDFLSTREGLIDGLGAQGTTRQWAGLALIATLPQAQLIELSTTWCEAVIMGALRELPAWPHLFRAYKRPLKPRDGRLFLPIALERYLLEHPQGRTRAATLLKRKVAGQMISGVVRKQLQDLVGRGSFFANRPSQRHLIAVDPHPERVDPSANLPLHHSFVESVALMPRALKSISRLLSERDLSGLISAPMGLELRAGMIHERWRERARSFFGRQLEVYEARNRVESWGRFLGLANPEAPSLSIRYNIRYYEALLHTSPVLQGDSAFDLLWGQHDEHDMKPLFNLARPFPAGLVSARGVVREHGLPFEAKLAPQARELITPSATSSALWMIALDRQLARNWPYKLKSKLEDTRAEIWSQLIRPSGAGRSAWLNTRLIALDSLLSALTPPPAIQVQGKVDPRELR